RSPLATYGPPAPRGRPGAGHSGRNRNTFQDALGPPMVSRDGEPGGGAGPGGGDRPPRRRPLRRRPGPDLRLAAAPRAALPRRDQPALGRLPVLRHRRDREGPGDLLLVGGLPAPPAARWTGTAAPGHTDGGGLWPRRFTPKAVARHADTVRDVVRGLVDAVAGTGRCEVVEELAAPLPAMVIGRLLGFDDELWPRVKHWSETTIVAGGGPRYMNDGVAEAFADYCEHAARLMEARQRTPAGDVMSSWMQAETAGVLTRDQVLSEGLLLVDGGAETTRTVITGVLLALIDHPDQHQRLLDEPTLLPVAVEEFIR